MASQLEGFVNSVVSLSADGNFNQLCEELNKNLELLKKNVSSLDNVLGTLDPQLHSLGVLAILYAKYTQQGSSANDFETLVSQTQLFLSMCNGEQIRFAVETYANLAHQFTTMLIEHKQPLRGIDLLIKAVSKIQMHATQLTSIHADICQLCLAAKCMKPALTLLDVDITDVSKEIRGGQSDVSYFLCYYYYGGMIYTAVKNWSRSCYFFEVAITVPAMAVSHIMLEAYKKYILVCLIHHGKLLMLPKYTSGVVNRFIKPLSQAYHDLANSYVSMNPADVQTVVAKHTEQFTSDQNTGLVKQVVASMYRKNIQRLTKTFLTLSLSDIARRCHLSSAQEAEKYVLDMIDDGDIFASINKKDGMVRFKDNPEKYDNPRMLMLMDEEMRKCIQLDAKLKEMEQEITTNPQFVQKSMGIREDDDMPSLVAGSK
ncbi:COP9 signalosome complex subunit 3-like [Anneissia japonica]|uniref:COP9 signalosome complex subunit 3-like n=1 Tax=Anneissia japonica TaxID=1529436 RepID=UPI00142578F3|nr:COP9 signalosome complex subunit 3-like [Anneissia japonica]